MSIPQPNQKLPEISLPAVVRNGEGFEEFTVTNTSLSGRPAVLFVYPRDATPGCTVEVCSFRELHDEFAKLGVAVIGISRDKIGAHRKFITSQNLPYALASDGDSQLLTDWELLRPGTMYGKPVTRVARTTYVVDGQGVVRHIFENVTPAGHAAQVLEVVQKIA